MTDEQIRALADKVRIANSKAPKQAVVLDQDAATGQPSRPGYMESFARGAAQGLASDFADEAEGVFRGQDVAKQAYADASAENPLTYAAGKITGAIASPINKVFAPAKLAGMAAQGALSGFGSAEGGLAERAMGAAEGAAGAVTLGAAAKGTGALIKKVVGNKTANEIAVSSLGGGRPEVDDMREAVKGGKAAVGQFLRDNKLIRAGDSIQDTALRIKEAQGKAAEELAGALAVADERILPEHMHMLRPVELIMGAKEAALAEARKKAPAGIKQAAAALENENGPVAAFLQMFGDKRRVTLPELQAFRASMGNLYDRNSSAASINALKGLERQLAAKIDQVIKDANLTDDLAKPLQTLRQNYQILSLARNAVDKGVSKVEGGFPASVKDAVLRGQVPGRIAAGVDKASRATEAAAPYVAPVANQAAIRGGAAAGQGLGLLDTLRQMGGQ